MCIDCKARLKMARDALLNAKLGESISHVAKGVAELFGIVEKTGASELMAKEPKRIAIEEVPASPVINARTGHIAQEKEE